MEKRHGYQVPYGRESRSILRSNPNQHDTSIRSTFEERPSRPQWKNADWAEFIERLAIKLRELVTTKGQLTTTKDIDQRVTDITKMIQNIAEDLIPKVKSSQYAKPYWTKECSRVVTAARKARRERRAVVSEASNDPTKLWKLAKWARKNAKEKHTLPQIPDIIDKEGKIHTEAQKKARTMAQHFFPPPISANTQDIVGTVYPEELQTIVKNICQNEVEQTLGMIPSDKAPGPYRIPNRLLKHCRKALSKVLVDLFNSCLRLGYHPRGFKESIKVVLRKPQKPSYDTSKAYRPVALLNTVGKLLEKLVANRISKAAEDHNLLPE
ncbi:putative zinc knuckle domain protein [Erysiphe necator]|uniref:Putative zinc knuckle domain protein n=1 Tax=Uncinula necator TaxID=52586 RepID=A0A0B1NZU6_UNCNE|nr:putative zinc knuckle domain protein [Erysiphe necator]